MLTHLGESHTLYEVNIDNERACSVCERNLSAAVMKLKSCRRTRFCKLVVLVCVTFVCIQIYYVYTINLQNVDDTVISLPADRKIREFSKDFIGGRNQMTSNASAERVIIFFLGSFAHM